MELPIEVIPWPVEEIEICTSVVSTKDFVPIPIEVYPNPAQNRVEMVIPSGFNRLEVYSILGKRIEVVNLTTGLNQLDIADLPSGAYIFHFSGDLTFASAKFIKP